MVAPALVVTGLAVSVNVAGEARKELLVGEVIETVGKVPTDTVIGAEVVMIPLASFALAVTL